ncbi:MAG: Flp pilus assembly protein CpaB [Acidobacteria bacterium]|nr:Flp pilus assembly protein CpaB [Acidobacteriota bacterium]MBI3655970.1 Flp pilus assembly protein CpaB [Acidobacteriota bacterium]
MAVNRTRLMIALAVAVVLATVVSLIVNSFFSSNRPTQVVSTPAMVTDIIVASVPVKIGTRLRKDHIKMIAWPQNNLPQGHLSNPEEAIGRAVVTNFVPNEPIVRAKLASLQSGGGLPAIIPDGQRAVTIRVDDVAGVAGFVLPDTRVDILMTREIEGKLVTKTVLQNVVVLAAGQQIQSDNDRNPIPTAVVTLSVTPDDAEKVTLIGSEGRLQLVLRNPADQNIEKTMGATLATVLYNELPRPLVGPKATKVTASSDGESAKVTTKLPPPPKVIPAPERPVFQVEVIRGNVASIEKFYLE